MSFCRVCSANITWTVLPSGEKIPLDDHEESPRGPHRYRVTANSTPPTIEPVPEEFEIMAQVDHRHLCQQPRRA